jgi:REP element-mobilizing transposase RayT
MPHSDEQWNDNAWPLAYLITIRTYGTWLHGDERRSVDTHDNKNVYGRPNQAPSSRLEQRMQDNMKRSKVILNHEQRKFMKELIEEECCFRGYKLHALNVRSNHVHLVVSAEIAPEKLTDRIKAFITRRFRESGFISTKEKLWSRGRSRQYLWKERDVGRAIAYVVYDQGDLPGDISQLA